MSLPFIPGEPPTWLGSGETEWKARLADLVSLAPSAFLELDFRVSSLLRRGHRFDLDNMVIPVLDQILGPRRSSHRQALLGWTASRTVTSEPGLRIVAEDRVPECPLCDEGALVLDVVPCVSIPTDSRDGGLAYAECVRAALGPWLPSPAHRFAVDLLFGDDVRDISWVAEKPVKPVVDCLFPLLGGGPGAPEDWKVDRIRVRRGQRDLSGACAIKVWEITGAAGAVALPTNAQRVVAPPQPAPPPRTSQGTSAMTNYERLDAAAAALGSPPATFDVREVLGRAQEMFPELARVKPDSASASCDYQTINVRSRASKPGDFELPDRWNRTPCFLKVRTGIWRRLSEDERAAFARLWSDGDPLLRREAFTAAEWEATVRGP